MNLGYPNSALLITVLIVAYQRVKNRVELNTPKSVEIRKETFTIQQATEQVTSRLKIKIILTSLVCLRFLSQLNK